MRIGMDIKKYMSADGGVVIPQEDRVAWHTNSFAWVDLQGDITHKKVLLLLKALVQTEAERDALAEAAEACPPGQDCKTPDENCRECRIAWARREALKNLAHTERTDISEG